MSWRAIAWAKATKTGSAPAKSLLLCLADYADEEDSCFPSQELLAEETEQSVRTVQRQLQALEEKGLLKRVHRARADGGRTSDRYFLLGVTPPDRMSRKGSLSRQDEGGYLTNEGGLPDTGVVGTTEPLLVEPESAPKPSKRQKPETTFPEGWAPHENHKAKCNQHGLDVQFLAEQFETWHKGKGTKWRDWDLAFFTWINREVVRVKERATPPARKQRGGFGWEGN